jgi:hypothetical protein
MNDFTLLHFICILRKKLYQSRNPHDKNLLNRISQQLSSFSVALSPQVNYTNLSTATCRRNVVPTFVDRGVSRGQRGGSPTVVNLSFLDRSRYFSFKVAGTVIIIIIIIGSSNSSSSRNSNYYYYCYY